MKTKILSQGAEPLYDLQYPARQVLQIIADTWTPNRIVLLERTDASF
jgi:hypothetical protein